MGPAPPIADQAACEAYPYVRGAFGMEAVYGYRFQRHNPLRPLSWRWQRAVYLLACNRRLAGGHDDPSTVNAVDFLAAVRAGRDRATLNRRWSGLLEAQTLVDSPDPRPRWEVEARLLTGQEDHAIAARAGLSPAAVHWFETLFFNVRDRLAARDWIASQAIGPGLWRGFHPHDLGGIWRAFGYNAGSVALDVIVPLTWGGLPIECGTNKSNPVGDDVTAAAVHRAILAMMVPANADPLRLAKLHLVLRRLENCDRESQAARKALRQATSILESLVALGNEYRGTTALHNTTDAPIAAPAQDGKSGLLTVSTADRPELYYDDGRDHERVTAPKPRQAGGRKGVTKRSAPVEQACARNS